MFLHPFQPIILTYDSHNNTHTSLTGLARNITEIVIRYIQSQGRLNNYLLLWVPLFYQFPAREHKPCNVVAAPRVC